MAQGSRLGSPTQGTKKADHAVVKKPTESLKVYAEKQACFSGEAIRIEIVISEDGVTHALAHERGGGAKAGPAEPREMSHGDARANIDRILEALSKRPRLGGDRTTTRYSVEVEWAFGSSGNKWLLRTSEFPVDAMRDILPQLEGKLRQEVEVLLRDYYNPAHEVFALCRSIVSGQGAG